MSILLIPLEVSAHHDIDPYKEYSYKEASLNKQVKHTTRIQHRNT